MIDPELAPLVDLLPSDLGLDDPVAARQGFEAMLEGLNREVPPDLGVRIEDRSVPGWEDDPAVPVRIYWPKEAAAGPVPGILMIHGGGFVVAISTPSTSVPPCWRRMSARWLCRSSTGWPPIRGTCRCPRLLCRAPLSTTTPALGVATAGGTRPGRHQAPGRGLR